MFGTYDSRGVFTPQVVRLGVTVSGRPGLFSGGLLAWPLDPAEYTELAASRPALQVLCNRLGFALAPIADETA